MNHEETNEAVRLSLMLGATRSERHGVYPIRKPRHVPPMPPALPVLPPARVYVLPVVYENGQPL